MSQDRVETQHLGWMDGKICLGAGPVRMRFTPDEAVDLLQEIDRLLVKGATQATRCGCEKEVHGGP